MNLTNRSLLLGAWVLGILCSVANTQEQIPPAQNEANVQVVYLKAVPLKMLFDKKEFTVFAGRPVEIVFENPDIMQHNLLISKAGSLAKIGAEADKMALAPDGLLKQFIPDSDLVLFATGLVNPYQTVRLRFTAPRELGNYPFICTFPGHWRLMNGVMRVVAPTGGLPTPIVGSNKSNGKPKMVSVESGVLKVALASGIFIHYDLADMKISKVSQSKKTPQTTGPDKVLPNAQQETSIIDQADLKNLSTWLWLSQNGKVPLKKLTNYQDYKIQDKKALLRYKVSGREIVETPQVYQKDGLFALSHTLQIGPGPQPLELCVGRFNGKAGLIEGFYTAKEEARFAESIMIDDTKVFERKTHENVVLIGQADPFSGNLNRFVSAALPGESDGCRWEVDQNHQLVLHIPAAKKEIQLQVFRFSGQGSLDLKRFAKLMLEAPMKEKPAKPKTPSKTKN